MLVYRLIDLLFQLMYLCLIARVILSWIPHNYHHPAVQLLYQITEPVLRPFRMIIPTRSVGIDISPILALIALGFIKRLIFWAI
jgi:YggT family protein|tara:strand:- start:1043 stop:1294 length:252 start_codon:yes stop_codon:yes gene_type:complete